MEDYLAKINDKETRDIVLEAVRIEKEELIKEELDFLYILSKQSLLGMLLLVRDRIKELKNKI